MEGTQTPGPSAQMPPSSPPPTHAQPGAEAERVPLRPSPAPLCGELAGFGSAFPSSQAEPALLWGNLDPVGGRVLEAGKFKSLASGSP